MVQGLITFFGGLAAILVANAIQRWKPFKWWLALGYWFNAQAWGGGDDTLPFVEPSCWGRVMPAPVCRGLASFFLLRVEAPPESEEKDHLDHQMTEWFKVLESWKRITARHQRRAHHPRGCRNPTNLRWCGQPNCQEVAACRITPPNRAVSREEGTSARFHEAAFAALPPTMAACTCPDVPATRFAPPEGLVASPLQGRPVDIGSLGPVVVAPRSGQRRALAVHGSRNEGAALPRAALCGTAPLRYAEELTVQLAVNADRRGTPISRVGDANLCTHFTVTHERVAPLEPIRKPFPARWTLDIHNRQDAGELHKVEGVP